jgi:hypothetical protein
MDLYLKDTGISTVSLHPGVIKTDIWKNQNSESWLARTKTSIINGFVRLTGKTVKQGATASIYCAIDDSIPSKSGLFIK